MRKALVTVCIGDHHTSMWKRLCRPNWTRYAERHGYDVVVIDDYVDGTPRGRARKPNWQKLLVHEHPDVAGKYDAIVWLDADILISAERAPCVVEASDPAKIGAVVLDSFLAERSGMDNVWRRFQTLFSPPDRRAAEQPSDALRWYGFKGAAKSVNTGVLVFSPERHGALLREVYDRYEENEFSSAEQTPLSGHMQAAGLLHPLDWRFNAIWDWLAVENYPFLQMPGFLDDERVWTASVAAALMNTWFLHFLFGVTRRAMELAAPLALARDDEDMLKRLHREFPDLPAPSSKS